MDEEQEQGGSYQAEETVSYETEVAEPVTTQEETPSGIKITYNGADELVSYDEAPTWIQKGKNYDKIQQRATEYEQKSKELEAQNSYLDKLAQMTGYRDRNEYMQAVDQQLQQQQHERAAQNMGVDTDTYSQYFAPVNQKLSLLEQQLSTYQQQEQERQQQEQNTQKWGALYQEFPELVETAKGFTEGKDPTWYNDDMKNYINRGYDPVDAYRLGNFNTISQQKEQEVLARMTGRDSRQVLSSIDAPNNNQFDPANMSNAEINAISERVRRGERITF